MQPHTNLRMGRWTQLWKKGGSKSVSEWVSLGVGFERATRRKSVGGKLFQPDEPMWVNDLSPNVFVYMQDDKGTDVRCVYIIIVWLELKVEGAQTATEGICREECKLFCFHTPLEISVFILSSCVWHLSSVGIICWNFDVSFVDFLPCNSLHARQELVDDSGICCCVPFYIVWMCWLYICSFIFLCWPQSEADIVLTLLLLLAPYFFQQEYWAKAKQLLC